MQEDFDKIKHFLDEKKVAYRLLIHEPVFTSEQAARVRGADLKVYCDSSLLQNEFIEFNVGLQS